MRFWASTTLLLALAAQCAQAKPPVQAHGTSAAPSPAATAPAALRIPESERKAIAQYPSWTAPQKPFRIYGNTWYVGPRGLGVYLITSPSGHALIDGGVPGEAAMIESNIRKLGFKLHDIKWILNTHAHYDHAGGIARLVRDTGAEVIVGTADAAALARGGIDDPQYGDLYPFQPVYAARTVRDGERLQLGTLVLTAHATPGHTQGNTTWAWQSCRDGRCLQLVDVSSLSAPGYKLIDNRRYPRIVEDYEHSFAMVAALPCDIVLGPHPAAVHFWKRIAARKKGDADALVNADGCGTYARESRKSFEAQLAKQRTARAATNQARKGHALTPTLGFDS